MFVDVSDKKNCSDEIYMQKSSQLINRYGNKCISNKQKNDGKNYQIIGHISIFMIKSNSSILIKYLYSVIYSTLQEFN